MTSFKENLKQLYYFYEAVNQKSISAAAKKLFISQPAVSMQIKKLESCCGLKLILSEGSKRIKPTAEGEQLFRYLNKAFRLIDRAEEELRKRIDEEQSNITIGTTPTYSKFILPYIFENYADLKHPKFRLKVISESSLSLLTNLKNHQVDIIVIALWRKLPLKDFEVRHLEQEEIIPISAPDHPIQRQSRISLKNLQQETFIMRDEQSGTRKYILREFKKRGVILPVSIECENPDLVKELIIEGKGIGFLTQTKIQQELEAGVVKRVALGKYRFYLDIAIVMNKDKKLMPEMLHFVDSIIKTRRQRLGRISPQQTPALTD